MAFWNRKPWREAFAAAEVLASHTLLLIILLLAIEIIRKVLEWTGTTTFWSILPISYVFDTADFAILILVLVRGGRDVYRAYEGKGHEDPDRGE